MEFICVFFITYIALATTQKCLDQELICQSYSIIESIKQNINSSNHDHMVFLNSLQEKQSRLKNEVKNISAKLTDSLEGRQRRLEDEVKNLSEQINVINTYIGRNISAMQANFQGQIDRLSQTVEKLTNISSEKLEVEMRNRTQLLKETVAIGPFGGPWGRIFTDATAALNGDITAVHYLTESDYRLGRDRITILGMSYGRVQVLHGGNSSALQTMALQGGEYIVGVKGCKMRKPDWTVIYELSFITNKRNLTLVDERPCTGRGSEFSYVPQQGQYRKLAYISGKAGILIDQITLHFFNYFEN